MYRLARARKWRTPTCRIEKTACRRLVLRARPWPYSNPPTSEKSFFLRAFPRPTLHRIRRQRRRYKTGGDYHAARPCRTGAGDGRLRISARICATAYSPRALKSSVLARACEEEITKSDRPTDAFPLKAIVPLFVVNKQHLAGWKERVPDEVSTALKRLTDRCFLCPADEAQLQNRFFALAHADLLKFRQGIPILKIVSAIKFDYLFKGRWSHKE